MKIKVCLNEFLNVIFENVEVDNKMYLTCNQYEPIYSAKKAFSSCVIALQFLSFLFYDKDNKMSNIFGCYEPFGSLKITFFYGFIAQYFLTFIIEHAVSIGSPPSPQAQRRKSPGVALGTPIKSKMVSIRSKIGELGQNWDFLGCCLS